MVLAKNGHFLFHWWYLGKSSQERSSFEILDTKEGLLDKKSQVLQKSKKLKFLVGLVIHSFIYSFIYLFIVYLVKQVKLIGS